MSVDILKKINNEIAKLPESKQLLIAKMIIERIIKKSGDTQNLDFRDLRGTGRGTWSKETVESYIQKERDDWKR